MWLTCAYCVRCGWSKEYARSALVGSGGHEAADGGQLDGQPLPAVPAVAAQIDVAPAPLPAVVSRHVTQAGEHGVAIMGMRGQGPDHRLQAVWQPLPYLVPGVRTIEAAEDGRLRAAWPGQIGRA